MESADTAEREKRRDREGGGALEGSCLAFLPPVKHEVVAAEAPHVSTWFRGLGFGVWGAGFGVGGWGLGVGGWGFGV